MSKNINMTDSEIICPLIRGSCYGVQGGIMVTKEYIWGGT